MEECEKVNKKLSSENKFLRIRLKDIESKLKQTKEEPKSTSDIQCTMIKEYNKSQSPNNSRNFSYNRQSIKAERSSSIYQLLTSNMNKYSTERKYRDANYLIRNKRLNPTLLDFENGRMKKREEHNHRHNNVRLSRTALNNIVNNRKQSVYQKLKNAYKLRVIDKIT